MGYGPYTKELGERLTEILKDTGFEVFYAHGDSTNYNVCKPRLYFGEYSQDSELKWVDIVVVDRKTEKVRVLCEIEEEKSHPLKTSGHMVTFLLGERIRVTPISPSRFDYDIDDETTLLIGLPSGEKADKLKGLIHNIVKPKLTDKVRRIRIVSDSNIGNLIKDVEREILSIINIA